MSRRRTQAVVRWGDLDRSFRQDGFIEEALFERGADPTTFGEDRRVVVRLVPLPRLQSALMRAHGVESTGSRLDVYEAIDPYDRGWQHVENMAVWMRQVLPSKGRRGNPQDVLRTLLKPHPQSEYVWNDFRRDLSWHRSARTIVPWSRGSGRAAMPPAALLDEGGEEYLVDGRHRVVAASIVGLVGFPAVDLRQFLNPRGRG